MPYLCVSGETPQAQPEFRRGEVFRLDYDDDLDNKDRSFVLNARDSISRWERSVAKSPRYSTFLGIFQKTGGRRRHEIWLFVLHFFPRDKTSRQQESC